jgi:hypothetical protein
MNTEQRRRGFEERLLDELRSLVVARPTPGPEGRPRAWVTSWPRRRLVLIGGVAAVLAVVAAAGVPFLSGGAEPAYAVTSNGDGTVTVEINSLSDAAGLQAKLREAGIRAVVQYLPAGKTCKQPWFTPASPDHGPGHDGIRGGVEHTLDGHTSFTISKHHPTDATLVIMTQTGPSGPTEAPGAESVGVAFAQGDVPACEIVDAPAGSQPFGPPPPGAGGQLHTEKAVPGGGASTSSAG